jgi:hypothetical protein
MLAAHLVINAERPGIEIGEDQMDGRQDEMRRLRIPGKTTIGPTICRPARLDRMQGRRFWQRNRALRGSAIHGKPQLTVYVGTAQ